MIALNELLNDIDEYREKYNKMGLNTNINEIVKLEEERKKIQLEFESKRAECNKMCHNLAILKKSGEDVSSQLNEIILLDKNIKSLEKTLNILGKSINKNLSKLPNLPYKIIKENKKIKTDGSNTDYNTLINEILPQIEIEKFDYKINEYAKKNSESVFSESDSTKKILATDGLLIIIPEYKLKIVTEEIINYLKIHSKKLYEIKTTNISKESKEEYISILQDKKINIKITGEYYTRKYNLKYRNEKIDMTKFINEIKIKIR